MRTIGGLTAVAAAGALAAGAAAAGGGPSPGAVQGWDGVRSADGSVRYVALGGRGRTVVAAVRTRGGRVVRFRTVRGNLGVPLVAYDGSTAGLSADGTTLVLAPAILSGVSRFAVLVPRTLRLRRTVTLHGRFVFDAVSPRGRLLYLIQYLAADGSRYRVRAYDLLRGRLLQRPVVDPEEQGPMRGAAAAQVITPSGRWVYTLYRRPGGGAFVHALDTARVAARCVDLPRSGDRLDLRGGRLAVRTLRGRTVAVVDTASLRVVEAGAR